MAKTTATVSLPCTGQTKNIVRQSEINKAKHTLSHTKTQIVGKEKVSNQENQLNGETEKILGIDLCDLEDVQMDAFKSTFLSTFYHSKKVLEKKELMASM